MSERRTRLLLRAFELVEGLPEWLRPAALGPCIVTVWMTASGALVVGPPLIALLLWFSDDRLGALSKGLAILGTVFVSSALGGLAYGLLGRPIRRGLPFGWLPAGWIAVLPYFLGLVVVTRLADGDPVVASLGRGDWIVLSVLTLVFGSQLGWLMLRPDGVGR